MLKDLNLNLKSESLVSTVFVRPTAEESDKAYGDTLKLVRTTMHEHVTKHLNDIKIAQSVIDCKEIAELEKLEWTILPEDFFERLINVIDSQEGFTDAERIILLWRAGDDVVGGVQQYIEHMLQTRAQQIENSKAKFILPNGKKKGGAKIIQL